MFRVFCGDKLMIRSDEREEALAAARALSREKTREILVEAPGARFVYMRGILDKFWLELRRA